MLKGRGGRMFRGRVAVSGRTVRGTVKGGIWDIKGEGGRMFRGRVTV